MELTHLLEGIPNLTCLTPKAFPLTTGETIHRITSDSRQIGPGSVFVALIGTQTDGHQYIDQAFHAGASAIIIDRSRQETIPLPESRSKTIFYVADNSYQALGAISSRFYGDPGKKLCLIGVTGTNGKTTVTHLLEKILDVAGRSVGMVGTLGQRSSKELQPRKTDQQYHTTGHTTPLAPELHHILKEMVDSHVDTVVMEVSSHALEQHRVYGCDFQVAIHTNVTQDHLDYHQTMERYGEAKLLLFSDLNPAKKPAAVINLDDPWAPRFLAACPEGVRPYTYALDTKEADVSAHDVDFRIEGVSFQVKTPVGEAPINLKIGGRFSVYNALAAIAGALALEIPLRTCANALEQVAGVRGRFEVVAQKPAIIVDYAHTPDGLENVLSAAKRVIPEGGRLIAVFGCGGDRDATKRPKMGAIAERLADILVMTSDNPRSEDPQQILSDIMSGIQTFDSRRMVVNADRREAIHQAIDLAAPNDVIVVAGKGHEDYQILATKTIHFDDREVVQDYISRKTATSSC